MPLPIVTFYHPGFAAPIGDHIMPIRKFALVAQALRDDASVKLTQPAPVTEADILRVHHEAYLRAIQTGEPRDLAESQKFPWSPQLYPSVCLTSGGLLAAARQALVDGVSAALVSGFHHAEAARGQGFCTFNGLVIAIDKLINEGAIRNASVLDCDLHYGNGTASLAGTRPYLRAISVYGNDYLDNRAYRNIVPRMHEDGANHKSIALPGGCDGREMLAILEQALGLVLEAGKPNLLLYQAGADPYFEDPFSPLNLNHEDLYERDRRVFKFAKEHQIPVAWVLAGGYTEDVQKVVKVHLNTFAAARETFA